MEWVHLVRRITASYRRTQLNEAPYLCNMTLGYVPMRSASQNMVVAFAIAGLLAIAVLVGFLVVKSYG